MEDNKIIENLENETKDIKEEISKEDLEKKKIELEKSNLTLQIENLKKQNEILLKEKEKFEKTWNQPKEEAKPATLSGWGRK